MLVSLVALAAVLLVNSADAGVAYTRWGRTVCPVGATRLYKGYMAGAYHNAGGNGANYLCLHESPKFVKPVAGAQAWTSWIVGVEMEYGNDYKVANGPFSLDNLNGGDLYNQDMVCAVCYVSGSTAMIMVPGRQDCGEVGFDLQYKGYIVAEAQVDRKRGEYVCLDEAPEGRSGGSANMDQGVIYTVQVSCGSIPCAPYVEAFELPCSVCTY